MHRTTQYCKEGEFYKEQYCVYMLCTALPVHSGRWGRATLECDKALELVGPSVQACKINMWASVRAGVCVRLCVLSVGQEGAGTNDRPVPIRLIACFPRARLVETVCEAPKIINSNIRCAELVLELQSCSQAFLSLAQLYWCWGFMFCTRHHANAYYMRGPSERW